MMPSSCLLFIGALLHSSFLQGSASPILDSRYHDPLLAKNGEKIEEQQKAPFSSTTNNEEVSRREDRISTSIDHNDVRDLTGISYVDCQIEMVSFDEGASLKDLSDFRCLTYMEEEEDGQSNMVYDLPEQVTQQLRQRFNDNNPVEYIRIIGARIYRHTLPGGAGTPSNLRSGTTSSSSQDKILVDDDSEIIVLDQPLMHDGRQLQRRRLITPVVGVNTAIVVRITTRDSTLSMDAADLSEYIFGEDVEGTVASQLAGCSFNKLRFVPAEGPNIVDGVVEVAMPTTSMRNQPVSDYENEMIAAIEAVVGSVSQFQHYLICVPPGTKSRHGTNSWRAYASVTGGKSIFNNAYCGRLSVLAHEIGHNLSFGHSGKLFNEYGDDTGLMGSLPIGRHYPLACFNGAKNWQIGWYADKSLTIQLDDFGPWRGKVFGFTDYDTSPGYVLLQVGDLYVQYNKADKFNKGTAEKVNLVTITRSTTRISSESMSMAGLGSSRHQSTFKLNNFAGGKSLTIEVCGYNNAGAHDYYDLLIQYDHVPSSCEASPSLPYPDPTAASTRAPTPAPTFVQVVIADTPSPSVSASNFPTLSSIPSTPPSVLASEFPSYIPSATPSSSFVPSMAPSTDLTCDDQKTRKFQYSNGTHTLRQGCSWLAARPKWKEALCKPREEAYEVCEETCEKCRDICDDTTGAFLYKGISRRCSWLALRPAIQDIVCAAGHESNAITVCPETCDVCDGPSHLVTNP